MKKPIYLCVFNPNWANHSVAVIAVDEKKSQYDCGNLLVFCGPNSHYAAGTGVSICGGYNRRIGIDPTHIEAIA
jgi:hypothetical protein